AMAPDHVFQDAGGRLVRVQRAGDGLDGPRSDLVALGDEVGELAHHGLPRVHRLAGALQRDHVAPQEDVAVQVPLQRLEDRVLRPRQAGGHLVGKLQLTPHYAPSASRTFCATRLPPARPPTLAIATDITRPMSPGASAPASATASATRR